MLHYLTVPVTPFQQNCSLVWCDATHKAAVIDPGGDLDNLLAEAQRLGLALHERGRAVAGDRCASGAADRSTETLNVRHCPGHTPGHVVFHAPQIDRAFVGDVLFAGSIGRTDFPQGNHQELIDSIVQRLWPMGDQTVFIPGHGPESTFGRERQSNPYVGGT